MSFPTTEPFAGQGGRRLRLSVGASFFIAATAAAGLALSPAPGQVPGGTPASGPPAVSSSIVTIDDWHVVEGRPAAKPGVVAWRVWIAPISEAPVLMLGQRQGATIVTAGQRRIAIEDATGRAYEQLPGQPWRPVERKGPADLTPPAPAGDSRPPAPATNSGPALRSASDQAEAPLAEPRKPIGPGQIAADPTEFDRARQTLLAARRRAEEALRELSSTAPAAAPRKPALPPSPEQRSRMEQVYERVVSLNRRLGRAHASLDEQLERLRAGLAVRRLVAEARWEVLDLAAELDQAYLELERLRMEANAPEASSADGPPSNQVKQARRGVLAALAQRQLAAQEVRRIRQAAEGDEPPLLLEPAVEKLLAAMHNLHAARKQLDELLRRAR